MPITFGDFGRSMMVTPEFFHTPHLAPQLIVFNDRTLADQHDLINRHEGFPTKRPLPTEVFDALDAIDLPAFRVVELFDQVQPTWSLRDDTNREVMIVTRKVHDGGDLARRTANAGPRLREVLDNIRHLQTAVVNGKLVSWEDIPRAKVAKNLDEFMGCVLNSVAAADPNDWRRGRVHIQPFDKLLTIPVTSMLLSQWKKVVGSRNPSEVFAGLLK